MKNVLLIGDSIRMGYDKAVRKTLEGKANVYFPDDNCRFALFVLRYLHEYKAMIPGGRADVIHWNAGLWDCLRQYGEEPNTPIEFYSYYVERVCRRIRTLFPEAAVIFATSTRVISEKMDRDFMRYNDEIARYNEAAVSVVTRYGHTVNDLYDFSGTLPEEAHSDPVHFYTPLGTEAFANRVLSYLLPRLDIREEVVYREELYTDKPIGM